MKIRKNEENLCRISFNNKKNLMTITITNQMLKKQTRRVKKKNTDNSRNRKGLSRLYKQNQVGKRSIRIQEFSTITK